MITAVKQSSKYWPGAIKCCVLVDRYWSPLVEWSVTAVSYWQTRTVDMLFNNQQSTGLLTAASSVNCSSHRLCLCISSILNPICMSMCMCANLLSDNRRHGDLQKLLLEGNKGQKAGVEKAQQLQNSGEAEQHWNARILQNTNIQPELRVNSFKFSQYW